MRSVPPARGNVLLRGFRKFDVALVREVATDRACGRPGRCPSVPTTTRQWVRRAASRRPRAAYASTVREADRQGGPAGLRRLELAVLVPLVIAVVSIIVAAVSAFQAAWLTAVSGLLVALAMGFFVAVRRRSPNQ
jgi:hypothetical protein